MQSTKYDRYIWIVLGLVMIGLCFCASCTTQDQWLAAGASTSIGYTDIGGSYDSRGGKVNNDVQQYGTTISISPFAWWGYKVQAEMQARAMVEAQYAERPPPPPPKPEPPGEAKPK